MPAAARRFLEAEEAHPLEAFGGLREAAGDDPRPRRAALADHRPRRLRRRRHHLDRDPRARAAHARAPTSTGTCRAGSTTATASPPHRRAARRARDATCWSPSTARSPRSTRSRPRAAAGMDVVVTDHHAPRADGALPDAPIVHPRLGGYPCPDLCAAGVAYKLAGALLAGAGEDPAARRRGPRPGRARHRRRRRPAHRREPRARARRPAPRSPAPASRACRR